MYRSMTTNLMVESVDESVRFYCDILGFSLVDSVNGKNNALQFAIIANDNLTLMFQQRENLAEEYPILDTPQTKPSVSLFIITDDFDNFYNNLKEKTAILSDVHTTFYGTKEFAIADNTGYVLTFAEHQEK